MCTRAKRVASYTLGEGEGCALSGHSKWHNIRLRKGKADAQRGAKFTKISKEIILAAKNGSSDPEANYKLKIAVDKARAENMPADNIKRAIARAQGANDGDIAEIRYEGHGPAGMAIIVDAATDNRNRTAAELRFVFSRHHGSLGESNSTAWNFDARGIILLDPAGQDEEAITELALVDGVVDLHYGEPTEVHTEIDALAAVRLQLHAAGAKIIDVYLGAVPKITVTPTGDDVRTALALLDALEDHDDVQRVFSNVEIDEQILESLA